MADRARFTDSARRQPGLAGAFFIDFLGTGMFLPFSLLFFLATTSLPLTRIGLGLSIAAFARIPATIAAGPLSDRIGPRTAIVVSQLLQAAGFANYLFVQGFWHLVAAAVLIQVGNSIFWVAYSPLVFTVAGAGEREHWFALASALRTAGMAAGGVIAGAAVAVGGHAGFVGLAVVNAASFVVAAILISRSRAGAAAPEPGGEAAEPRSAGGWIALLRDYAFLGFVAVNVGITFLALASTMALPVFLVKTLGLPAWTAGLALALNSVLVTAATPTVMGAIQGRRRQHVLMVAQAFMIAAFAVFLILRLLPTGAAIAAVLIAIAPIAACEVMQGGVVPAIVTDSATHASMGRYVAVYQVTFCIGDIVVPVFVTAALHFGPAALWLPMSVVALADLAVVAFLARRMTALTHRVGQDPVVPGPVTGT